MKNYPGVSSSAHKKGVQSVGGPAQLQQMNTVNTSLQAGSTNSILRHTSMTPDRHTTNSNQHVFVGQSSQQIKLGSNQKGVSQTATHLQEGKQTGPNQIPQKAPRGNMIKKQKIQQPGQSAGGQNSSGLRGSSQQLPSNIESIQQLGTNMNNSVAAMMNARLQQPSPAALANSQAGGLLNQNTSIEDILAQQQNFAKNYNNSTALIGSSRKAQKIQIHMKNNRFHNRKASGPAALNPANATAANLQNKQFLLQQASNVSQERITNYDSSIQQQNSSQQFFDAQSYNSGPVTNVPGVYQTRGSSRQGGRLNSGNGQQNMQGSGNVTAQRPSSKGGQKGRASKDKQNPAGQTFGRTFFHPPSNGTQPGLDHAQNASGPALIDHNQILSHQFNTTTGQITTGMKIPLNQQVIANHVRAGTQIDMHQGDQTGAGKAKQFMNRKEGSLERSNIHFQKPGQISGGNTNQFDMPSSKHAKSKSQNKFSQPDLSRYANSIERIGTLGTGVGNDSLTMQSMGGASNKDKRQNYSLNPQQQAHLKQNLQKTNAQKQTDAMLNSAYSLKSTTRKQQMKASQQLSKKMLGGVTFPASLNQTQSVRFVQNGSAKGQNGQVQSIQNYNSGAPLTSSTNQSGMNSTTAPNAHLIFTEGGQQPAQSHFVNTATIPLIKNGEPQQMDSMKSAYANTQILDRLFNQQNATTGTGQKKRSNSKNSSVVALSKAGQVQMTGPGTTDFMPSSATSATAFYAATKQAQNQSNGQMFSNYQLQNMGKQKGLMVKKQGASASSYPTASTQPVDMARIQGGTLNGSQTIQSIMAGQAQQMSTMGTEHSKGPSSVNAERSTKNNFYLKQQLQQNNRSKHGSKDRASMMKKTPVGQIEDGGQSLHQQQQQHRKNHSVVINRAEVLRVDGKLQRQQIQDSPDVGQNGKALKLPGMQEQQHMYNNMIANQSQMINNNYASQIGDQPPQAYLKSLNQSATNATTKSLKTKGSARSVERQNKQGGAMTPSIERTGANYKGKGSQSIHQDRQSYIVNQQAKVKDFGGEQQYPGSGPMNYQQVLNNTKQVMVTDGGTGASLKRVFIQQESNHTSQADSQSNYGSTAPKNHSQNYHLPIKAPNSNGIQTKQSKRIQMQKMNANKFAKGSTINATNNSYQSNGFTPQVESSSEKHVASSQKPQTSSGIAGPPQNQTISSSYKANLEQKTMQTVTRAQAKLRTESRKDNRAISVGIAQDYASLEMDDDQSIDGPRQGQRRSISINITQEALRLGKIPTEKVAANIAQNKYNKNGSMKGQKDATVSPRIIEMVDITHRVRTAFDETGEAPETTTDFYRAGKMLGRGAFGKVNLGMHKMTRKLIAIKSINQEYLTDDKQRSKIMHEVGILLRLRHQSVVKLYETFETKRHIMLVMELCAGGDLLNFVRKRKKCPEDLAKILFKQIIEGIGYIHSKSILHRDIKLDNILLDGKGNVKIADFGVSKTVKRGEIMYEQSGTPAYIAPEIIKNEGYRGFKADLWSAGVVLFALLFGTVPFKANNMKDLHQQILQARYNMKEEVSEEAQNMIRGLLCVDPKKRLSTKKVLMHPWLAGTELLSTDIFNDDEKEVIRSEFTYNDPSRFNRNERVNNDEEPWDCFTELNLDSMNQTLRNASEKSLILAPFNSTMSDVDGFFKSILSMAPMEPKKELIKFAARCRDQDRQYEINNNAELDNGVYHKFVYSTKDSKVDDNKAAKGKGREEAEGALLSRNSSRQNLPGTTENDSEDLTKPRDKTSALQKEDLKKQREALKADIRRLKNGKKSQSDDSEVDESSDELANTNQSHFNVILDDDRVITLTNFGYPKDYVKYTILENEANYCVTAYYLMGIDQNY